LGPSQQWTAAAATNRGAHRTTIPQRQAGHPGSFDPAPSWRPSRRDPLRARGTAGGSAATGAPPRALWVDRLSQIRCTARPRSVSWSIRSRKSRNSTARCFGASVPITVPGGGVQRRGQIDGAVPDVVAAALLEHARAASMCSRCTSARAGCGSVRRRPGSGWGLSCASPHEPGRPARPGRVPQRSVPRSCLGSRARSGSTLLSRS
jgi:hypothetical protein